MRTAVGKEYSDPVVEQDIRALYATGKVQNVRIFGQPDGDGVRVIVALQTRANVNEIEIDGATRISAKALRKIIKLKINSPLNEDTLGTARQDIISAYRAKGYNDVDVQYKMDVNAARGTSRVVFTINEGAKGAISAIRFEGNRAFSDSTLRKQMKTKSKTLISFLDKSGRLDEAQFQQDLDSVREWYQDHGYVDVEVGTVRRERTEGRMMLVVPIVENGKYYVGHIIIKGTKVTTPEKVRAILKMKEGSVYSPKAIREDAKAVADGYGSGGYVDLVIQPQGTPAGPNKIDITYTIEEGNRAFVQRINIVGNTRTKDKVIRREVLITPGDIYSTTRVETSKKRLDNLGYFSRVETYPEDTGVEGRKDLVVQVEEKRTGSLNFGAGFSTVDNIVGFVELSQGNFDLLNWPNFTGGGQKFRLRIQYGSERQDFTLALTEPYFLDRRLSLGGELFYREASFLSVEYNQREYGLSILARKGFGRYTSGSVEYRLREVDIFDVAAGASLAIRSQEGSLLQSQIGTTWLFDSRDNPFLSHTGQRLIVTPFVSGGFLGGDVQTYGFNIEASQYFHFPYDLILLLIGRIAGVIPGAAGDVPLVTVCLFSPGFSWAAPMISAVLTSVTWVRRTANGDPIGGNSLARATDGTYLPGHPENACRSLLRCRICQRGLLELRHSTTWPSDAGIGLRLDLPIGPLRSTTAFRSSGQAIRAAGKFNFNVGYQF